jgi:hypothetical protein
MCDLSYVILLRKLEAQVNAELVMMASLAAAGGKVEIPDPAARRAEFDTALSAEPDMVDPDTAVLMDALGVGYGRHAG